MSIHLIDEDGHLQSEGRLVEYLTTIVDFNVSQSCGSPKSGATNRGRALDTVGMDYHVVGVFGGQSSGKSTLLNHLFGTHFQMLDEKTRRGQTTKGAFLACANTALLGFEADDSVSGSERFSSGVPDTSSQPDRAVTAAKGAPGDENCVPLTKSPLLVMDFEGTDGLERGENQSFERQLSLFGLSIADTLIINMWAVDVGRFNAANLNLLRTIFEVNLQLFSHENYEVAEKPTLLIVLRDFTEDDPAPSLATVRKSFDTIWDSITRPSQFEGAGIDSLFQLRYFMMPHYKLQKKEFMSSVEALRRWFGDIQCTDYLFSQRAMFRGVPLEGLPAYLTNCWEAIRTSKDLDIPTQREMLAQHRCKEVKEQELNVFRTFAQHHEEGLARGEMLLGLSKLLDKEMEIRLTAFHWQTRLYSGDVVMRYASELETELVDAAILVLKRFCKVIASEVLLNCESRVLSSVDQSLRHLLKAAQTLPLSAGEDASASEEAVEVDGAEGAAGAPPRPAYRVGDQRMDSAACQRLVQAFWRSLSGQVNEIVEEVATVPPPAYLYGRYADLVAQDQTVRINILNTVTDVLFQKVKSRVVSMSDNACETMHGGFERSLTHYTDGTVRFFSTTTGLQKSVPGALQAGLLILGCIFYFRLKLVSADADDADEGGAAAGVALPPSRSAQRVACERRRIVFSENDAEALFYLRYSTLDTAPKYPYDVPVRTADSDGVDVGASTDCVLLSQQATVRSYELYRQKCDFTTQLQLRAVEAGNQRLPAWVIPLLFILGWNELLYVLTSPFLLVLLILVCTVFFKHFFVSKWRAFEEVGPASLVVPAQKVVQTVCTLVCSFLDNGQSTQGQHAAEGRDAASARTGVAAPVKETLHVDPMLSGKALPTAPETMRHRTIRKVD